MADHDRDWADVQDEIDDTDATTEDASSEPGVGEALQGLAEQVSEAWERARDVTGPYKLPEK
jgi:hypothetical protein